MYWGVPIDEYWSEEDNVNIERGVTYPRIEQLVERDRLHRQTVMQEAGWATHAAMNDPKLLTTLGNKGKVVDMDKLPAMLRPTS